MNYLSHFYIDRHVDDPYFTFGAALPDLHKGFSKVYNRQLRNNDVNEYDNNFFTLIHQGIDRHFEVDSVFHNSKFFDENVEIIKRKIQDRIPNFKKAYFAAHILLEMLLDRQIVLHEEKIVDNYYDHLNNIEEETLHLFFEHHSLKIRPDFFDNFHNFLNWKYLYNYQDATALTNGFSKIYFKAIKQKLDSYSLETLSKMVEDMDEILKLKWRNPFNNQ